MPATAAPAASGGGGNGAALPCRQTHGRYSQIFTVLHTQREARGVSRDKAFSALLKSGLAQAEIDHIWTLSDVDADGLLSLEEFVLAMHLTNARVKADCAAIHTAPHLLPKATSPATRTHDVKRLKPCVQSFICRSF